MPEIDCPRVRAIVLAREIHWITAYVGVGPGRSMGLCARAVERCVSSIVWRRIASMKSERAMVQRENTSIQFERDMDLTLRVDEENAAS